MIQLSRSDNFIVQETMLKRVSWSAVIIGVEALRRAAWATPVHYIWDIAMHEDEELPIASHFYFNQRPRRWYEQIVEHGASLRESENLLFYLKPAWALADALAYMRTGHRFCSLDPDDIQPVDVTDEEKRDWRAACAAFGLDAEKEALWLSANGAWCDLT